MVIKDGVVFMPDDSLCKRDIRVENGIITEIGENLDAAGEVKDAGGLYVLPGLCDIHSHGAVGHDFCDANEEGLKKILAYEREHGITAYMPTSMTIPKDELKAAFTVGKKVAEEDATIVGFHMEGPFINPEKKGAQKEEDIIAPDVEFFRECQELSGGRIKEITVAPEMEGAFGFIDALAKETMISVGHTKADYDTAKKAMEKGAVHVTHIYNAMPPFTHRMPGVIGAAFDVKKAVVELIADGVHIHEAVIRAAFRMFEGRVALISDSMRATGLNDGSYTLGGQDVTVNGKIAKLNDGTIAGSVTNLFDCMRNAIAAGIPKEAAFAAATRIPAAAVGVDDRAGSIAVGRKADIILVDKKKLLKEVV